MTGQDLNGIKKWLAAVIYNSIYFFQKMNFIQKYLQIYRNVTKLLPKVPLVSSNVNNLHYHSTFVKTRKPTLVHDYQLNFRVYSNFSSFSSSLLVLIASPECHTAVSHSSSEGPHQYGDGTQLHGCGLLSPTYAWVQHRQSARHDQTTITGLSAVNRRERQHRRALAKV